MARIIIGIMGPGAGATAAEVAMAYRLGAAIARQNWVLLSGGRNQGVMDAASRGAKSVGGLTIGILPEDNSSHLSPAVDIPLLTGLGQARNAINVLSSQVIVACGLGPGTTSEIALAIKASRPVLLMETTPEAIAFFQSLGSPGQVTAPPDLDSAIAQIHHVLSQSRRY